MPEYQRPADMTSVGGCVCHRCGSWIPNGVTHTCSQPQSGYINIQPDYGALLIEIRDLLKEIRNRLNH